MCAECDEFKHATTSVTRGKPKPLAEQFLDDCSYLMPHSRRPYDFPVSRDWEHLDCKAVGCRWNKLERCMVPSLAKIGPEGRCEGFEAPPYEVIKPLDGD